MGSDTGNPKSEVVEVLMIEDDEEDALLLQETLSEAGARGFEVAHVDRLSTGLEMLAAEAVDVDVVLLDLNLPDGQGLDTLMRAHGQAPNVPIIVLTGTDDKVLAVRAVQAGAQDYLVKGQVDSNLLVRSIRYAIERHRLLMELEQARQREQQEEEMRSIERLSRPPGTAVTAQTFGVVPLREGLPEIFNELIGHYGDLMDLALEQRGYKVEHDISEKLRSMAERMGFLKAGPRDVVEIHTTALKGKSSNTAVEKMQAYVEEGRLIVLELMGYLVSYYRNY
jgi:DNA-binding response OmpR family regulator